MKSLLDKIILKPILVLMLSLSVLMVPAGAVMAITGPVNDTSNAVPATNSSSTSPANSPTASDSCKNTTTSDSLKKCVQNNKITQDLQLIVNVLSAGVGIVVIAMIILGGIQYSIAGDNAQAVSAAKHRISNALLALFAYLFIFAFLQWLIPGGLFG